MNPSQTFLDMISNPILNTKEWEPIGQFTSFNWTSSLPAGAVVTVDTGKMQVTVSVPDMGTHVQALSAQQLVSGSISVAVPKKVFSPEMYQVAADYVPSYAKKELFWGEPEPIEQLDAPVYVDLAMATDLLERAVKERGHNFCYSPHSANGFGPNCRYYHKETHSAGCIVGMAMTYLGVSLSMLDRMDRMGGIRNGPQQAFLNSIGITMSVEAIELFATAQQKQDCGVAYGSVLAQSVGEFKIKALNTITV